MATTAPAKTLITLRVSPAHLAEIDARASDARLSRTEYMIRCGLGEIIDRHSAEDRLDRLEERLGRLEEIGFG